MPFACIYVPNFPVAAALRAEPELQARAVAIVEGKPPLETILAVNEASTLLGIAPGMTKAQAELCSDLALRPRSSLQESAAHSALLDCGQSFSPCVEDAACDTALLDLAGMESLFGSLPEISRAISNRATTLGLAANVAVASNPDAAVIAARGLCGTRTLARVGITVIPAGKEAEQLGPLPVEVLFANPHGEDDQKKADASLLETLDRWGIRNLRGLAALPEIALSERLGQEGLRLQQLARGAASRTLVPVEMPLVFEEAVELEHPIVLLEPLAFLQSSICSHPAPASTHARCQSFSQVAATGFECASSRRAHREDSSSGRTGTLSFRARRIILASLTRAGKTGTHSRPHRQHGRQKQCGSGGVARHASSRRISHAALSI
jgi:protein ImuB